jgi:hypothetical protein
MTSDETPNPAAAVSAAAPTPAIAPVAAPPRDEFDPFGWQVPVICKDCGKDFSLPYRHFKAGVVFHCPHCHGSFVPKVEMDRDVRQTFETFYARRQQAREQFERGGGDAAAFRATQERELQEFRRALDQLAHAMRPAGKMVKRGWLAAMFT